MTEDLKLLPHQQKAFDRFREDAEIKERLWPLRYSMGVRKMSDAFRILPDEKQRVHWEWRKRQPVDVTGIMTVYFEDDASGDLREWCRAHEFLHGPGVGKPLGLFFENGSVIYGFDAAKGKSEKLRGCELSDDLLLDYGSLEERLLASYGPSFSSTTVPKLLRLALGYGGAIANPKGRAVAVYGLARIAGMGMGKSGSWASALWRIAHSTNSTLDSQSLREWCLTTTAVSGGVVRPRI